MRTHIYALLILFVGLTTGCTNENELTPEDCDMTFRVCHDDKWREYLSWCRPHVMSGRLSARLTMDRTNELIDLGNQCVADQIKQHPECDCCKPEPIPHITMDEFR